MTPASNQPSCNGAGNSAAGVKDLLPATHFLSIFLLSLIGTRSRRGIGNVSGFSTTWKCSAPWLWFKTKNSSILPASSSSSGGEGECRSIGGTGREFSAAALCVRNPCHQLIGNLPRKNLMLCLIFLLKDNSRPSLLCCLEASFPT